MLFTQDIGIDLGTANTLVFARGKGIVIREPSVVAVDQKSNPPRVVAVGTEAKEMIGRTPGSIIAVRPLKDGVIADFEITAEMIESFIKRTTKRRPFSRIRVLICIPSGVTEVERKAVHDAAKSAGANYISLIEEPMAAAIGAGLPVSEATGSMVVDIGERTAEDIKIKIGSAFPYDGEGTMNIKGRNLMDGRPKNVDVTSEEIREAMADPVSQIVDAVKSTLEKTPPELAADIIDHGIMLTGGGALLRGLDRLISAETKIPVLVAENPLDCVVDGTGICLDNDNLNVISNKKYI